MTNRLWMGLIVIGLAAALGIIALSQPWSRGPSSFADNGSVGRGRAIAARSCAVCHGADGESASPQIPKLSDQEATYIVGQLAAFKSEARRSDTMSAITAPLSRDDMADLAAFYASRAPAAPDTIEDGRPATAGERIFFGAGPMTPSCAACHERGGSGGMGMGGMGMMGGGLMGGAVAPRLDGQHAAYTVGQLDAFADGARPDPIMTRVASSLSAQARRAVAEYISGRR